MYYGRFSLTLIIAAVIPAVLLLIFVYCNDRLEKEPWRLLRTLLFQGIIATSLAAFTERLGGELLSRLMPTDTAQFLVVYYFLVVALSEEGFKYLLLKSRTWNSPEFNCQFDGVVYAMFVSLGFALWENIDYVVMFGFQAALIRAITAVPGHAAFGVFMGVWYGLARRVENWGDPVKAKKCRRTALLLPTALHGLYDLIASLENWPEWVFIVFILGLFITSFTMINKLSRQDRYI